MRVLLIHERFAPDSGGGGEYAALERAKGLREAGCEVRVLCPGDPAIREVEGIPTHRVRLRRQAALALLPQAVAAARQADIVHGFTFWAAPLAYAAARIARRPVVCEQLGLFGPAWAEMRPGAGGRMMQALEKAQLRLPFDAHLFLSPGSLALARQQGFRGRGHVVAPGIGPQPGSVGRRADPPLVLFAGKLDRRKGLDRLYEVAARMPEARFEAVGWQDDGAPPLRPPSPNLTITPGRGAVYHDALARASLLFMPSRAETFGLVLYEAMQAGLSVVSTIGAEYEGVWLDPWSADRAVAAIRERLSDPGLLSREGDINRRRAAGFTWARSTAEVRSIYDALLSSTSPGRRRDQPATQQTEPGEWR